MHGNQNDRYQQGIPPVRAPQPVFRFNVLGMTGADLPAAYELSKAVSWPHRLEDWQFVLSVGEGLVAYSGDRLVGTAMWWSFDKQQVRLGMVIVDPTIQRSGVGRALMQGILDRIVEPTIILNATKAGETLYRQLGFSSVGSIIQHQGASFSVPLVPLRAGERIRPMGRNDAPKLIELDAQASGVRREGVIAALIETGEAVVLDDGGETVGFAFYRRFGRGHAIGPVIARDTAAAKALVAHWIGSNAGMFMRIDIPGESGLSNWLEELGLARVSNVLTMVRGMAVAPSKGYHVFAAANQALG
jgi:GNAT superfamily N-acetyltransferase